MSNLKVGQMVTLRDEPGEWCVSRLSVVGIKVYRPESGLEIWVYRDDIEPVSKLPDEPPMGEVVWVNWEYRTRLWSGWCGYGRPTVTWYDIASDAEPVVPVSHVAEWMKSENLSRASEIFLDKFGWPCESPPPMEYDPHLDSTIQRGLS